jgi:adenine phosphoribosyltransferase
MRNYPDFPQKGIIFRDISPILADPAAFAAAVDAMAEQISEFEFDKIVAVDARGFLFGGALAYKLGKGMVICRKPAKLPGDLVTQSYGYEYDSASLSIQKTAVSKDDRVIIVDDVLATGNTFLAAYHLIDELGGRVEAFACFVELAYLNGRELLEKEAASTPIRAVINLQT